MTISDLGSLGSFLAAIAVFITLIYLARQVKQGNILAKYQARQTMMEQDLISLQLQITNIEITSTFAKKAPTKDEMLRLHLFLTHLMRQREWEWHQYRDGIIDEDVYTTYHEVIAIFLGTPRTIRWWHTVGRAGIDPKFAQDVDLLLAKRGLTSYWKNTQEFISNEDA